MKKCNERDKSPGIFRVNGFIPVSVIASGHGSARVAAESALLDAEMLDKSLFENVPLLFTSADMYS